jgi:hypothetical protein
VRQHLDIPQRPFHPLAPLGRIAVGREAQPRRVVEGPPCVPSAWSLATILSGSYGGASRSFNADTNIITG